jgi:hypothetical protein
VKEHEVHEEEKFQKAMDDVLYKGRMETSRWVVNVLAWPGSRANMLLFGISFPKFFAQHCRQNNSLAGPP